jgi:hypothetical protein
MRLCPATNYATTRQSSITDKNSATGAQSSQPRVTDSPHQNHDQCRASCGTCGAEDEPKDARSDLESFVIGFESVHESIALPSCKRPPIVESIGLTSLHISLCYAGEKEPLRGVTRFPLKHIDLRRTQKLFLTTGRIRPIPAQQDRKRLLPREVYPRLTTKILIENRVSSRLIPRSRIRRGVLLLQIDGIAGVTQSMTSRFAGLCRRTRDAENQRRDGSRQYRIL